MTRKQNAILVGTVLGDGYLQSTGRENARLRLEHGFQQKKYLFWKVRNLKGMFKGKITYLARRHPLTDRIYRYWRYQTNTDSELGKLRSIFYPNQKKCIPENLEKFLVSPISLAVWYMDDGYYYKRDRVIYIYLGNVSEHEARIATRTISNNFRIANRILKKKRGYALYFSPKESLKLIGVVKKYILPIFNYKIP